MSLENQRNYHNIAQAAEYEFSKIKDGKLATQLRAIMAFEDNTAEEIANFYLKFPFVLFFDGSTNFLYMVLMD